MDKTNTLLFSLFALLLTTSSSKDLCHKDDKNALLKIKKAMNDPYAMISWDSKDDCCTWVAVECGDATLNHRVTTLVIQNDGVSAQIPPEVGDLPYLQTIIFHKLPNLTGEIPPTIVKLRYLRYLWLSWNSLTGPVPEFLSQLKNLEYINLSFNNLSGSIPGSLSLLPKLGYLELSRNKLTGKIPESFGSFKGVVPDLFLSHNQLSGSIPKSLGNLDFNRIDLSRNKLEGDASMMFGAKKTAWSIDLSRNKFQFDISKVIVATTVNNLVLNHNGLTGSIPVQWTQLSLQTFNVSYNRLCGRIPQGGDLQRFDAYAYLHNKCLCGAPLRSCNKII
ncbi:Polygalacturonase inhibitor 1 [Raphanus sativus]|uniref:Polygalacturonase inhibitor 2-like n=1 Tax=Raphanus sativus TaxID=3726 RepID=A0A9W3DJ11_RAPSA|nr:polygalacturonase inhibitor 2-like [Raphanus sativus]XP_056863871.1 polygalacturonase inhibitor 2-like [Raphanus sativus]XP_056863872.1 polygalacturonase inhibitor 2-like [Raphanus sativus]XP_056863873.1 polygalacturonase inhibitor 2-like [Raphanus sativus]XP_056863874.1 polygalacturonase inhibitor 2-like [Raphanus sativus]KAJ4900819.1 Polygalacturonase inhibitor 1 [Raphanus sativus]